MITQVISCLCRNHLQKSAITLFVILSLVFFSACAPQIESKPKHIGIVLFGDSRQPQTTGFIDGLNELINKTEDKVNYSILNAKNDRKKLSSLVKQLIDQKVDLLVAAGGLEADAMKDIAGPKHIPVVVLYVNAIVERGLVKSREAPGWSVTGVDNLNAELSGKRIELMQELNPTLKKVLILYYQRIAPSRIGVEIARKTALKKGIEIDARAVNSREEIRQVMASLKPGEVDAMLTVPTAPIDNALEKIILPNTIRLKIPLFSHSRPMVEKGAFAAYGAHFYDLGKQASRLAYKVINGINPEKIPFETPKQFIYTLNRNDLPVYNISLSTVAQTQIDDFITKRLPN